MKHSKARAQLVFDMAFYERLLEQYPDFVDVLIALGQVYTRAGLYDKGLAVDLKLTRLRDNNPVVWYNLACSYCLLQRLDEALSALQRALALGYDDLAYLLKDPDLATLRQSPKLRQLLKQPVPSKTP